MVNVAKDYPSDWESRREQVYKRDDYTCQNCGTMGGSKGNSELHAHHIVPKSSGGTHDLSNLKTLCEDCHQAVHTSVDAPTFGGASKTQTLRSDNYEEIHFANRVALHGIRGLAGDVSNEEEKDVTPFADLLIALLQYTDTLEDVQSFANSGEKLPNKLLERYFITSKIINHILTGGVENPPSVGRLQKVMKPSKSSSSTTDISNDQYSREGDVWDLIETEKSREGSLPLEYSEFWDLTEELLIAIKEYYELCEQYILVDEEGYVSKTESEQVAWELNEATEALHSIAQDWNEKNDKLAKKALKQSDSLSSGEGCFIATAAMGTRHDHTVQTLRWFRDRHMKDSFVGRIFIKLYYSISPPVAGWIAKSARRRRVVRTFIVLPAARLVSVLFKH